MDRDTYKVVDALEEVTNFWSYGRNIVDVPVYNTYMPTRYHIMNKPDMMDSQADDLSY
jgi:hypothetical protein